jgi:tripartite-type tricarboxylate transporter receptor subunit TctC
MTASTSIRSTLAVLAAVTALCANAAEAWPNRPLRVIVPVGAGSTTDIIPRLVFEHLALRLGQPIVVENRSGAGGTIGTGAVARAEADGYTVLAHGSAHTIAPALYAKLAYDPSRDFAAVVPFGVSPSVLVVSPASPYRRVADLVAVAKARPGTLTFSSVGIGTATHLSAERFRSSAGIEVTHVPYKGGAEAMMEVVAGRIDFFFAPVGLALPLIREGKLLPLVVNGARRSAALPDVPTTGESGFAEAEYPIWFGLFLPASTPRDVVDKLNRETLEALRTPQLRDRLAQMGLDPLPMTPREFDAYVKSEIALNATLVSRTGIKPE